MKTVPSGVQGLDEIISGGFIKPSVMLVAGPAGSGKTTFAMQSLFKAVTERGETGLYIPTISEPVAMVNNFMSQYEFYNFEAFEKRQLHYKDLSDVVSEGWEAIVDEIRSTMEQISPTWVVIDPLTVLGFGLSDMEHRYFLNELFSTIKGWDTMVVATGEFTREKLVESPYSYMVDGAIYLGSEPGNGHCGRYAEVLKLRGKPSVSGKHFFKIEPTGIHIYPRIIPTRQVTKTLSAKKRFSSGIKGYDDMLGGGFLSGSMNLIAGTAGTGKTVFGISFIAEGVKKGEKGILVVFEESPAKTIRDAETMNFPLGDWIDKGMVEILYYPPGDAHPEEVMWGIKNAVENGTADEPPKGNKRLLFDSMTGFDNMVADERALTRYLSNLDLFLSGHGVTTVITANLPNERGNFALSTLRDAMVMDSATMMRYVEVDSSISRFLAVLMMKGSKHHKDMRQYSIEDGKIEVMEKYIGLEGLMSGSARKATVDLARVLKATLPESQRHIVDNKR